MSYYGYYDSDSDSSSDYYEDYNPDALDLDRVQAMGATFGYNQTELKRGEGVVAFRRASPSGDGHELVRVWWRTGLVRTYLKHPTQGKTQVSSRSRCRSLFFSSLLGIGLTSLSCFSFRKRPTQLFRRDVDNFGLLGDLFNNPRRHTGRGYHSNSSNGHYERTEARPLQCPACGR